MQDAYLLARFAQLSRLGSSCSRALAILHDRAMHTVAHTHLGDPQILRNLEIGQLTQAGDRTISSRSFDV